MTVVDASVATAWFAPIGTSERALEFRSQPLCAPVLLKMELTSSLLKYFRAGLLPAEAVLQAQDDVEVLIESWWADKDLLTDATEIALTRSHKIYDCLYLALALRRRERLITADRRMAVLARDLGIDAELLTPSL